MTIANMIVLAFKLVFITLVVGVGVLWFYFKDED